MDQSHEFLELVALSLISSTTGLRVQVMAQPMDAKIAVEKAYDYANDLFGGGLANLMLEELTYDPDSGHWLVTLGYDTGRTRSKSEGFGLALETTKETERAYKLFRIDEMTGGLVSIEIRKI